ncbi:hypothetical protein GWI33_017978 [Rhynchophorus ferrugineus]|uniref:Uncharacterized protein n=1 Tax=Rhynchophorus ferrugineus TaxID=354439 RepID=A0A834M8I8_RHYFE|nr:hypothetical protein GWI33_017978 [Rhynchophorus ferrugineus]
MFNQPPYPPKDHVLKEMPKIQRDSPQFTPDSLPRVTQNTLGIFCSPIEYQDGETPDKIEVESVHPTIMNKWINEKRAYWVEKPGKDDFFLHDMVKKYSVETDTYNPTYKHREKVFNRSYKYELVCLEEARLQKVRDKCEREETEWRNKNQLIENRVQEEKNPPMKVKECEHSPPFWWAEGRDPKTTEESKVPSRPDDEIGTAAFCGRWAEEPCLTAVVVDDPCRRKLDMNTAGQPFKNEACNFYYRHYPPPDFRARK